MAKNNGNGHKNGNGNGNGNGHKPQRPARKKPPLPEPIIDIPETVMERRIALFVDCYFSSGCNATKAALMAGYDQTPGAAKVTGHRLMRRQDVKDLIGARLAEHKAGADEVLRVLSMHLRADLGLLLNEEGEFDWKLALKRGVTPMIKKVKIRERRFIDEDDVEIIERNYELELHDSQAAAGKLAGIMGLEQKPRENEKDSERKAKMYDALVDRIIERALTEHGQTISRLEAINQIAAYQPEITQYIH